MDSPNLMIKLIPPTGADWIGNVRIRCKESELEADICYYKSHRFLGFGGTSRSVKGTISDSNTSKAIYQIEGEWDRYHAYATNMNIYSVSFNFQDLLYMHGLSTDMFFFVLMQSCQVERCPQRRDYGLV